MDFQPIGPENSDLKNHEIRTFSDLSFPKSDHGPKFGPFRHVKYLIKIYRMHIQIHVVQFIGEKSCHEFVEPFPGLKPIWLKNHDFR